jgi:hypothetical protein
MKNTVFWNITPCGSCKNRRVGKIYSLHHQGETIGEVGTLAVTSNRSTLRKNSVLRLLVVLSSPILVT